MSPSDSHDVVVIGAGMAGLSAARTALRVGLSTAFLEAQAFGGLVLGVNELDGAVRGSGAELASGLMSEVADLGGRDLESVALGVERDGDGLAIVSDTGRHSARAVVVASGASLRKLGVPGEAEFEHKGVSHCADCDGPMFRGQTVTVVGGGDSALQSALILARSCALVHLVHRGTSFRAQAHYAEAVRSTQNIRIHWNGTVAEIVGNGGVEGVRVNGDVIPSAGFFAFVGLEPASGFLPGAVARDARGAIITGEGLETSMAGVYAAGAVRAGCGGSVENAMAEGNAAALAVAARLGVHGGGPR